MFFDKIKDAREYARDQSRATGSKHKAISCRQWRFDRITGEYDLHACFTVVLG